MLTVLVKKPNGHETIYECDELTKEPNAILMRGDHLGSPQCPGIEVLGPKGSTMAWDWDRKVPVNEPRLAEDVNDSATVYVMNRHGKTVQSYHL